MKVYAQVGCVRKRLVISSHALNRISQRFGWSKKETIEFGKEVCKIYHRRHSGVDNKAEITLSDSVWVVKRIGKGVAIVKTVMPDGTNYAMREFL